MKRLLIVSVLALSALTAACGSDTDSPDAAATTAATSPTASTTGSSGASATPSKSDEGDDAVVASGDAKTLAGKLGCQDIAARTLSASDKKDQVTGSVTCTLNDKTIVVSSYKNESAAASSFTTGKASYKNNGTTTPVFVAVGDTWIAVESSAGDKTAAEAIVAKLGGRVEDLSAE